MAASRSISECFSTPHAEPLTENTPSAARQERLARLVQRLRRQVRGEVQLVAGMARLLPVDSSDVPAALAMARELAVPVYMGAGAPGRHRAGGACVAGMPGTVHPAPGSPSVPPSALSVMAEPSDPSAPVASLSGVPGLWIDPSAHLTRAAHFDAARGLIELQPGVRLADINRLLAPHGWWLPFETDTAADVTVGGLAGLDAAAATPAWGTMADRLLAIDAVLDDGTVQRFGPFGERSRVALTSGRAGQLVSGLFGVAAQVATDIHQHWPAGMRVPDGYLLDAFHPRPSRPYTPDGSVNLAHLLAGSAGTLAWSASLHLRLRRRPAVSRWALFVFPSAGTALARVAPWLQAVPSAGRGPGGGAHQGDDPGDDRGDASWPSALLLLDRTDLSRLATSRHADDRALVKAAGVASGETVRRGMVPGLASGAQGAAVPDRAVHVEGMKGAMVPPAQWQGDVMPAGDWPAAATGLLARFSGDTDAAVQAVHRRLAQELSGYARRAAGGLVLAGDTTGGTAAGVRATPDATPIWRQLLGELVMPQPAWVYGAPLQGTPFPGGVPLPAGASGLEGAPGQDGVARLDGVLRLDGVVRPDDVQRSDGAPLAGQIWRLWPQDPAVMVDRVAAVSERLASLGLAVRWRGQLASGELQLRLGYPGGSPKGAGVMASQQQVAAVLADVQPPRWTPALREAFGQVRAAFDPAGVLVGR